MKTSDQYFDCKVYPSGKVVQYVGSGCFYSTDGQFSVTRPERAALQSAADLAALLKSFGEVYGAEAVQAVEVATVLDYLTATANVMGKPGAWLNGYNGVDARVAHFILLAEPYQVRATVTVVNEHAFMPAFDVDVRVVASFKLRFHRSTEPTLAHAINVLRSIPDKVAAAIPELESHARFLQTLLPLDASAQRRLLSEKTVAELRMLREMATGLTRQILDGDLAALDAKIAEFDRRTA